MTRVSEKLKANNVDVHDALFWDTFQSWEDKLAKGHNKFRLMGGHSRNGREVGPEVTNLSTSHMFPSEQSFLIRKVGVRIVASDEQTHNMVTTGVSTELVAVNRIVLELPASMALVPAGQLAEDEEPSGLLPLEVPISILQLQHFLVTLTFSPALEKLTREIETKVGPGSAWYSVAYLMWGEHSRAAY